MAQEKLKLHAYPKLISPRLIMGFSGWMNGGEVSLGTIDYLVKKFKAQKLADIDPSGFYLYSFPGSMELTALFRPHTAIREGIVEEYSPPANSFYFDQGNDLIYFSGKEPNLAWEEYGDAVFSLCKYYAVDQICFIGSVSGLTPHSREPRITFSCSDENTRENLLEHGLKPSDYEGPASIVSYLTFRARQENISLTVLVAEIPAYIKGFNPRCIETMTRLIGNLYELHFVVGDLHGAVEAFDSKIKETLEKEAEFAEKVKQLEQQYDSEAFDREMTDLESWFRERGFQFE
ncbi:MAG: hypothetical protein GF401_03275 [Chitinivibrionales bacterium]|nr:hypothetical protein [Chitinivibrionales bacterium]